MSTIAEMPGYWARVREFGSFSTTCVRVLKETKGGAHRIIDLHGLRYKHLPCLIRRFEVKRCTPEECVTLDASHGDLLLAYIGDVYGTLFARKPLSLSDSYKHGLT